MPALYLWTPDLAVGVGEIDRQHQELFRQIDLLVGALQQGRGTDRVTQVLRFLEAYIVEHFSAEERWMEATVYPSRKAHRAQHVVFMSDFATLRRALEASGPSPGLAIDVQLRCGVWLREHIGRTDRELGAWLSRQGQGAWV